MDMITVAVNVETTCGTCRMPMPVNTLAREVGCTSCGRSTAIGEDLWQALLRDPIYDGPKMLQNEGRRTSAGKLSASYVRRGPCCQGCDKEIPFASIQEVQQQAMLGCDVCSVRTWVRAVPAELARALPNVTHLAGEDPDPTAVAPGPDAEPATFPCPQCGSPVPFDGTNRACTCRFCSASVHVPDQFVHRGRRKVAARWFLCFDASIADDAPSAQAVAAGLFDWKDPPLAVVDAEGNLYCAATQAHWVPVEGKFPREKDVHVLWSITPSMDVRWLQRGLSRAVHLALSPRGTLLVTGRGKADRPWLSTKTGLPVQEADGTVREISGHLLAGQDLACDHDGCLLIMKDGAVLWLSPGGADLPERRDAAAALAGARRVHRGWDGLLYGLTTGKIVRLDASGGRSHEMKLASEDQDSQYSALGVDAGGNAYVLGSKELVRISATGEQSVILMSKRDKLPRSGMRMAVHPDGSFWLFGEGGAAWKFDASAALVFASEKEPRPPKPTSTDVFQAQMAATKARLLAEHEERSRRASEQLAAEKRKQRPAEIALLAAIALFLVLGLVAVFLM
ncbi:uncharacterized protein SOCEGT47_003400 [Sorangium cellulosum]|uniref:Uncharacterized protein n=1 Tax=Sorangium cellulosum TaxID=56 RepID=A0A4P2PTE6_SORCE|nr:uncharacterized protein SOCEGT47_003400 [Sorangium cellulosum]